MKRPKPRTIPAALLALLALCAASGCKSTEPEFPLGDPRGMHPVDPVTTAAIFPLAPRQGAFVVTDGKQKGQSVAYSLSPAGKLWRFRLEGKQDTFFAPAPEGALGIVRENDAASAVSVAYDPAILTPARLEVGKPCKGVTHMVVHRMVDGSVRDQGECKYSVELLGWQVLTTPTGRYEAVVVRTTRHIRLRFARVTVMILDAYDPDGGQVAQRVEQDLWPLGLVRIREHEELRLAR